MQQKMLEARLKRVRHLWWGVTSIFILGLGLSVLLQVLHAPEEGGWVAQVVGGFPPVAVFVCIEMISRIPVRGAWSAVGRVVAAASVSGMAAWLSFDQQQDFILDLGFGGRAPILFPLIIDGVMLVATLSLVEVARQVRELRLELDALMTPVTTPAPEKEPVPQPKPAAPAAAEKGRPGRKPGHQPNQPDRRRQAKSTFRPGIKQRPNQPIEARVIPSAPPAAAKMSDQSPDVVEGEVVPSDA